MNCNKMNCIVDSVCAKQKATSDRTDIPRIDVTASRRVADEKKENERMELMCVLKSFDVVGHIATLPMKRE